MNIIELSKQELASKLVAYTEFILDFKKDKQKTYCFYEGIEDRSYYSIRLKLKAPTHREFYHYNCNGKDNVVGLEKLLSANDTYSKYLMFYFVDKDFDVNDSIEKDIYVTPTYSIENFFSLDEAFKNILINEYQIPSSSETFSFSLNLFSDCKKAFHQNVIQLNAWLSCQSKYRNENNISTRLNIESILKKKFGEDIFLKVVNHDFTINFPDYLKHKQNFEELFSDTPIIDDELFTNEVVKFNEINQCENFRGKFEMKFLVSFLTRFQSAIAKKNQSIFPAKFSSSLRFEYATAISQLTNNAVTPECLISYMQTKFESVA